MKRIAVHGFGRIGRSVVRSALTDELFAPTAVSDVRDAATLAALFEVDTNYGRWHEPVRAHSEGITVGGRRLLYLNAADGLPDWKELGVDLVIDCTGRATTRAGASAHLERGAERVLVSAASKSKEDCDAVLLPGINLDSYDPRRHRIVSMASCTTNALAPVVKVVRETFGIQYGFFSTVHAYTNTQALTDQPMRDRRDSWAAAENIIPSSSGAARALSFVWPGLRITGRAYRVPVRTGSLVELNVITERPATVAAAIEAFRRAAATPPLGKIMDVLDGEWASSRIVGDPHSSIVDLPLIQVEGDLLSVAAWYDNELGYATRLAEVAAMIARDE